VLFTYYVPRAGSKLVSPKVIDELRNGVISVQFIK
jgi:hypothetical protein